jgi:5,10-methylenetetrahydromethanopterin reductase
VQAEFAETVAAYVEHARGFRPQGAHYLANHRGHLMFVRPDERPFVTAEMIRRMTFTGTRRQLQERIEALSAAGYTQIAVSIPPGQESAVEDWGRLFRAFG